MSFAVYIPIGPSFLDLYRVGDLISSICIHEPSVDLIALVDHGSVTRDFSTIVAQFPNVHFEIIKHCVQQDHGTWRGAGCVTNLVAINLIAERINPDFVLKLDTDALVIGPFEHTLSRILGENRMLGIVGTRGSSCNLETRTYHYDLVSKKRFEEAFNVALRLQSGWHTLDNKDIARWNLFGQEQNANFTSLCEELRTALPSQFSGEHCQGGAYAISKEFMSRMKTKGYLENVARWLYMPIDEDKMMGAYCACIGLTLGDLSNAGEPFGVQNVGLAYEPHELLNRRHSIIHSLRNYDAMNEIDVRNYFRRVREETLKLL